MDHPNLRINEKLRFQELLKSIISYDEASKLTDNHIIDLSGPKYKQAFSESPIRSNIQAVKLDIVDIPWKYIGQRSVHNKKMHVWLFAISHDNAEFISISLVNVIRRADSEYHIYSNELEKTIFDPIHYGGDMENVLRDFLPGNVLYIEYATSELTHSPEHVTQFTLESVIIEYHRDRSDINVHDVSLASICSVDYCEDYIKGWRLPGRSIARYYVGTGEDSTCTGSLISNGISSTPYFITAAHCIPDSANNMYAFENFLWNYTLNNACEEIKRIPRMRGIILYRGNPDYDDIALVKLLEPPPLSARYYNGWTTEALPYNTITGDLEGTLLNEPSEGERLKMYAITHPGGKEKEYALGRWDKSWWDYKKEESLMNYLIYFQGEGVVEGGSSGGPVYIKKKIDNIFYPLMTGVVSKTHNLACLADWTNYYAHKFWATQSFVNNNIFDKFLNRVPLEDDYYDSGSRDNDLASTAYEITELNVNSPVTHSLDSSKGCPRYTSFYNNNLPVNAKCPLITRVKELANGYPQYDDDWYKFNMEPGSSIEVDLEYMENRGVMGFQVYALNYSANEWEPYPVEFTKYKNEMKPGYSFNSPLKITCFDRAGRHRLG